MKSLNCLGRAQSRASLEVLYSTIPLSLVSRPAPIKLTKRPSNIPLLTTIPLQSRIFMMERSFSSQKTPIYDIVNKHSKEQDPVTKEKAICEGVLQQYCGNGTRYRVVADEHQPEFSYRNADGTQVHVPDSHIKLYRVEETNTIDAEGKGIIYSLYLYVHAEPSKALIAKFTDLVRERDEAGELATPKAAFAVLQAGMEIMFFKYDRTDGSGKPVMENLGPRP